MAIRKYELGEKVCVKGELLGRVVGVDANSAVINGAHAVVHVSTSYGNILRVGIAHLTSLDESQLKAIARFEQDAIRDNAEFYGNKLTKEQLAL